jgi:hypothetical protein
MGVYMQPHWAVLIILATVFRAAPAETPGSSPTEPAPVGATVTGIIECGQGYTSHELYDMRITVIEVVRGEEAWKRLREASDSNKPAATGLDYVLARVKFEYHARGTPGLCVHQLVPGQFTAYSSAGDDYKPAAVATPKPEMRKDMRSGETMAGWIVFSVNQQDQAPLMLYSADSGGAVMHGGGKWFLLR